jgi:hypothetical protein
MKHKDLNRLLCAAVVNNNFRKTLLNNPDMAIQTGYYDQRFSLTKEERDLLRDNHGQKLEDLAANIYRMVSQDSA